MLSYLKDNTYIYRKICIVCISFIATILFPIFICDNTLLFSNSIFSVIFFAILYVFLDKNCQKSISLRLKKYTLVLGFLLSIMTAFGYYLEIYKEIPIKNVWLIAAICVYAYIYSIIIQSLWRFIDKFDAISDGKVTIVSKILSNPYIVFLIIFICWIPCYISTYPGNYIYDATAEFEQSIYGYSGDFPLLHSFVIIKILSVFYKLTGSYNLGIAFYTIVQMILLSILFTHIICTFYKQKINRNVLFVLLVYYAIFPSIHMLVTCTVRDVMFSGLLTYSMFLMYKMSVDYINFWKSKKSICTLAIILTLTLLSRNNNTRIIMPIVLLSICFIIIILNKKVNIKKSLLFCVVLLGSYLTTQLVLTLSCQPLIPAQTNSSLSLLSQSIVRTYVQTKDNWSDEDIVEFNKYVNMNGINYVAENADSTKWALSVTEDNKNQFFKFWLKKGLEYPGIYIDAILANSRQMWFPGTIVDGYNEYGLYAGYEKCYFSFTDSIGHPGTLKLYLPSVRSFYKDIGLMISFEKIPIISMMFSIGFHFWTLLNCVFYVLYKRCYKLLLPLMIILGYTIISAFVPLVLLRYFSALFFVFPIVMAFSIYPETLCENK